MLYNDSNKWLKYTDHVIKWEGNASADPNDTASRCAPQGQKIHTMKGVTYCTFKDRAQSVGISPVTYQRFLNLTNEDSAKFLYSYYKNVKGDELGDSLSLAVTEASWGSGTDRAYKHLIDALASFGQTATSQRQAREKSKLLPAKLIFDEYIKQRQAYLNFLTSSPKYAPYKNGWNNRLKDFYTNFNPEANDGEKKNLVFWILGALFVGYLLMNKTK